MKALILAGGRGKRLEWLTENMSKSLLKVWEKYLIEYNLEQAVELGVSEIIITVCYHQNKIIKALGKDYKGVKITYVKEKFSSTELPKTGIVDAIEKAKEAIGDSDFILMLSDEIVVNAKMKEMLKKFRDEELFAICGIVLEEDKSSISKTYSAMINEKGRAFRLIEKPRFPINKIKGTGHCIMKNEILECIPRTPINAFRNQRELVDLIQIAIDDGKKVHVYPLTKDYVNVNTEEDFALAKEMIKNQNPKVLIVHNQMKHYGGAELLIVQLANWMTKMGIKNDILALSSCKRVEDELINTSIIIPEHDIDLNPPGYKDIKDIFKAIKVFRKKLAEIKDKYDIINFHDFPTTWSLFPRKKPAVWFMNNPPNLYSKPNAGFFLKTLNKLRVWLDKVIIRNTMDSIAVAEALNGKRAKQRYGMNARMVNFGVDYEYFSKGDKKKGFKQFEGLENKFIIMQSGQICDVKNQLESIKAVEKVKDKISNALLILTGREDAEYKKKLDVYIKEKKLEKYVKYIIFFGEREKLRNLYKTAYIGLFPVGKQGGVLAPMEMACAGVPIIVSEEMETASLIKQNNLGIVTKDYAKAILEIYNNQEKYKELAKNAGLYVKNNLSWKSFSENMIKAFKDAWKKHKKN